MSFKIQIVPTYKEVFKEITPSIEELLKGIPTKTIIVLFSIIMSELEKNGDENEIQEKIWNALSFRFPQKIKNQIIRNLYNNQTLSNSGRSCIFIKYYVMEFLQHIILNYDDVEIEDTTPENEVNIFKAYLVMIEKVQERDSIKYEQNRSQKYEKQAVDDFFQQQTWSMYLKQHSISRHVNIRFEIVRGILFNQFLEKQYPSFFDTYLKSYSATSFWEIFVTYLKCLEQALNNSINFNEIKLSSPILSNIDARFIQIIDTLLLDTSKIEKFKNLSNSNHLNDFLMIRESPILKVKYSRDNQEDFFIMNMQFLKEKLFKTLVFDFYIKSGIKQRFKILPDFLSNKALLFTERILFKSLIENTFKGKYNKIIFDEIDRDGMPDCYVRIGKYIFLIELKDNLMAANIIENRSYTDIKKDLDKKFISNENGKPKGIGQLINNIYKLNNAPFEFDKYEIENKVKTRNLVVIPVMVYTDHSYSMIGIQDLLRKEFSHRVDNDCIKNLGKVEDMIFINLETFYDLIACNLQREIVKHCLEYNTKMRKMSKQFRRNQNMDNDFKTLDTIEQFLTPLFNKNKNNISFDEIGKFMNIEFPKDDLI